MQFDWSNYLLNWLSLVCFKFLNMQLPLFLYFDLQPINSKIYIQTNLCSQFANCFKLLKSNGKSLFKNKNNVFLHLLDYLLLTLNIYFGGGGVNYANQQGKKTFIKKDNNPCIFLSNRPFFTITKGNSIFEILIRIQYLSNLCLLLFRKDEITSLQKQKIKIKMSRRRRRRNHERIYISTIPPLCIRLTWSKNINHLSYKFLREKNKNPKKLN